MLRKITLILLAIISLGVTTQAQSSRLSSLHRSYFFTSWSPYDSANFVYSNGRGGDGVDFEFSRLKFDTSYFIRYTGTGWSPQYMQIQTFDNNNNIIEKIKKNWEASSATYENAERSLSTYDANNDNTEIIEQSWSATDNKWINTSRIERSYDVNHNRLTDKFQSWANNAWENYSNLVLTYNANNDMLTSKRMTWNTTTAQWDSTMMWKHFFTGSIEDSTYTYNWSGTWQAASRFHLDYDVNNKPTLMLYQQWKNNDWENISQRFTSYASQYSEDSSQTWNTTTNTWENDYFYSMDFNANNDLVKYFYKTWDDTNSVWRKEFIDSTSYNALGQKESYRRLSWMEATQSWGGKSYDNIVKYYYENYTADVKALKTTITDLQLYPVPTGGTLHVSAQFEKAEDFKIVIYDLQGRIIKQWGVKGTRNFNQPLHVGELANGNYILQLQSRTGQSQQQFSIMK